MMKKNWGKIKNKKIFLILSSFLLLLFLPFSFIHGEVVDTFLSVFVNSLVNILTAIILFVPMMIGMGFLTVSTLFFGIIKSRIFEGHSYTGFDNPIVAIGFPVVQGLANVIILIGILVIGLATILGIEEYRAQRKLPALIICALLINFSGVLCGFVVDVSNVLTNHFLKDVGNLGVIWKIIKQDFLSFNTIVAMFTDISFTGQALVSIIFCFLGALIIFVLGLLLIVRKAAIPVLVVLAPAAIASYIMPEIPGMPEALWGHRKFFNWWLSEFLKWCFVGITVTFFMWLATSYIGKLSEATYYYSPQMRVFAQIGDFRSGSEDVNFLSKLADYFGVIFILFMAMQLGFQTAAWGANTVIGLGKKAGAALSGQVGRRVGAGMRRLRTSAAERLAKSERLQKVGEKIKAGYQKIPAQVRTGLEYGVGRPIYAIRKGIEMATGFDYAGMFEESKKKLAEAKEKFKKEGASAKKLSQTILNPFATLEDKVAAWTFARETGQFGKLIEALNGEGADPNKLLVSHIQGIAPINPDLAKSLIKINPHLAGEIKKGLSPKTAKDLGLDVSITEAEKKAMQEKLEEKGLQLKEEEVELQYLLPIKILMKLTPEEFVSVNPEAQKHPEFQEYLTSSEVSVSQFRRFLEQGDPKAVAEFKNYVEKLGGWSHFEKNNKAVWNWINNSPAVYDLGILREQEEGTKIITDITEKAFEEAKRKAKERG